MHWIALQPPPEPADRAASDPATPADMPTALAWWALQFTPLVARVEAALVLEVSHSERLFGGRAALLQRLFDAPLAQAVHAHAQGETSLLALGRLWAGLAGAVDVADAPIDRLPLHTLAAARPHLPTLHRLGCTTWGQLRALPRGGLVRRFGAALIDALDCAYGMRPELYPWLRLPEVFEARLELSAAVESAEALLFGARRLLAQLQVWLRARQSGVLALELRWDLDARRSNALHVDAHHNGSAQGSMTVRTAVATQDIQHLQRLLGEQLAKVNLPAPVLYLHLRTLQTHPLGGESQSLLPHDIRKGDSLHQMLERLGARLGREQILCVQHQAQHQPEHQQVWRPWTPVTSATREEAGSLTAEAAWLPTWLLPVPQPLAVRQQCPQYHGPLTLLAGPQRLEIGWLEGEAALRDYFVAQSPHAGLLWIFRERLGTGANKSHNEDPCRCWFLHGLFA